ncbi:MAG TPA: 23S rRNA (cytidine(2498)-2'-O)-methyltransferase RlmM [Rudaea sp.]|jgi:23S rRNA (cytidine2498-2'-O)-methyltransferase
MQNARELLSYCRPGFETECAQEISAAAAGAQTRDSSGFVVAQLPAGLDARLATALSDWRRPIFARQRLPVFNRLDGLPRGDRLTPILAALKDRGERYCDAWVEAPDSDEGKALAPFCKSFGNALIGGLKRSDLLDRTAPRRLHAFFPQSDNVYLCSADPAASAPWPQGIPRLKFPRAAPSRSTLKLEEAFLVLLGEAERERWLRPGMSAVDLGAAPGGWTWQFVRRSLRVTAIDNGPMDRALMESGLVAHLREDGFRFRPKKAADWMVCDMVEQPRRIAELVARWLAEGRCRRSIFNLKLPMKKRYDETLRCLDIVRRATGSRPFDLRARQLYHDREEITVFAG